jgi:short-subunit dehydrogenase
MKSNANFMNWETPGWAIITGASSGIGEEFARQLGAQGFSLLLIARRKDRLEALAETMRRDFGAAAEIISADLNRAEDIAVVRERLMRLESPDILVNNAGFGTIGPFWETDIEGQTAMLRVHNEAPVRLTHALLPTMIRRNRGVVILTSSMSAFVPSPGSGLYIPTKAFLVGLARVWALELKGTDVRVQALCPGYTRTGFHDDPAYDGLKSFLPGYTWGTSAAVVRASLRGARRNKPVVVPGFANRAALKFVPKKWMVASYMKNRWDKIRRHEDPQKLR